jgi:hypothetical protein
MPFRHPVPGAGATGTRPRMQNRSPSRLWAVRYGLPLLIAIGGLVLLILGHGTGIKWLGIALMGTALLVVIANQFVRLSLSSQSDRDKEVRARQYLSRTGHWPDEEPGAGSGNAEQRPTRRSPPPGGAPSH